MLGCEDVVNHPTQTLDSRMAVSSYMGQTFPHLCAFWHIMHEVVTVYYGNEKKPLGGNVNAQFAEFKFRELLAWSNALPPALLQVDASPHHVLILQ